MRVAEVIETRVVDGRRLVKCRVMGKDDIQEIQFIQPFGIDSNPRPDKRGVHTATGSLDTKLFLGVANDNCAAEVGEVIIFSEDENNEVASYIHFKADGNILINGDTDNAVRFKPMAETIKEIQDDIGALKNVFSTWVVVPADGGAALKAAAATWFATPLVENIDDSKIDEVKVP